MPSRPHAYSRCVHCKEIIQQAEAGGPWVQAGLWGDGSECEKAPNPDDGPMPPHESDGVIAVRPTN
jgi:hypothetical protein